LKNKCDNNAYAAPAAIGRSLAFQSCGRGRIVISVASAAVEFADESQPPLRRLMAEDIYAISFEKPD